MFCHLPLDELYASHTLRTLAISTFSPDFPFHASNFPALQAVKIHKLRFPGSITGEAWLQKARDMMSRVATLPLVVDEQARDNFFLSCPSNYPAFCSELAGTLKALPALSAVRRLSVSGWNFTGQLHASALFSCFVGVQYLTLSDVNFKRDQEVMGSALQSMPALKELQFLESFLPYDTIAAIFHAQQANRPIRVTYSVEAEEELFDVVQQQWDALSRLAVVPGPLVVHLCRSN